MELLLQKEVNEKIFSVLGLLNTYRTLRLFNRLRKRLYLVCREGKCWLCYYGKDFCCCFWVGDIGEQKSFAVKFVGILNSVLQMKQIKKIKLYEDAVGFIFDDLEVWVKGEDIDRFYLFDDGDIAGVWNFGHRVWDFISSINDFVDSKCVIRGDKGKVELVKKDVLIRSFVDAFNDAIAFRGDVMKYLYCLWRDFGNCDVTVMINRRKKLVSFVAKYFVVMANNKV